MTLRGFQICGLKHFLKKDINVQLLHSTTEESSLLKHIICLNIE